MKSLITLQVRPLIKVCSEAEALIKEYNELRIKHRFNTFKTEYLKSLGFKLRSLFGVVSDDKIKEIQHDAYRSRYQFEDIFGYQTAEYACYKLRKSCQHAINTGSATSATTVLVNVDEYTYISEAHSCIPKKIEQLKAKMV